MPDAAGRAPVTVPPAARFLLRLAQEFRNTGWVFTGFHWPVLAGQLAALMDGAAVVQLYEAGAAVAGPAASLPTSTTDYAAYDDRLRWRGTTLDVLAGLVRRVDRVVLDAGNVDVRGRINATAIGPLERPRVRLAGGGGAPEAAARARHLVLAFGSSDLRRLQRRVEHVTAAPGPRTTVRLVTRWGVLSLGRQPRLLERMAAPGGERFDQRLDELGVDRGTATSVLEPTPGDVRLALKVLRAAAERGYITARRALEESG